MHGVIHWKNIAKIHFKQHTLLYSQIFQSPSISAHLNMQYFPIKRVGRNYSF